MKNTWRSLGVAAITAALCAGCVMGQKYNYAGVVGDAAANGNSRVGVATHDQRPYVLAGTKASNVVGLLRGGFGNPFDVTTESGQPLATDMTQALAASLAKKGFRTVTVVTTPKDTAESVLDRLKVMAGHSLIVMTLSEWRSDTLVNTGLYYEVTLRVFDPVGKELALARIQGADNLGSGINTASYSRNAVAEAFKRKLEELLNHPDVVRTLQRP